MKNIIRLFIKEPLFEGQIIKLVDQQFHYLIIVMRSKVGRKIKLFNQNEGEWLANLININKRFCLVGVENQLRKYYLPTDLWLIFSPLKPQKTSFLVEKNTEIGITKFLPVITENSAIRTINHTKLELIINEATEQSERLDVPELCQLKTLNQLLNNWPIERQIIVAVERSQTINIVDIFRQFSKYKQYAILIGPEGGFSEAEINKFTKYEFITLVNLGSRILRAETASIALSSLFYALIGDWNS